MTELQDIIGQIPMGQVASLLGTDEPTARAAVEARRGLVPRPEPALRPIPVRAEWTSAAY